MENRTPHRTPLDGAGRYRIRLRGQLDPSWSAWLGGLDVAWDARGDTVLRGYLPDQAALHGVLTRVRDLGVTLVSIELEE
jgi:hypothetical protein